MVAVPTTPIWPGNLVIALALLVTMPIGISRAAESVPTLIVKPEQTPLERRVDGTIEAVNQGTVSAQTSGRILEVLYDVNDFVPAGAVIVRIRNTEQRASLDQALADRDAAAARLSAARAGLAASREGVSYTEVRAPYAGVVTRRLVQVGESVQPGTPLMSGLSLQFLRVNVDLPQSLVEKVRVIRKAAVYVNGRRIDATRLTLSPQASEQTNTFRVRVDLPENAVDLYPGMFVKVAFVVGEAERLLIPVKALIERSEVTAVYVRTANGRMVLRQIRVGHRFDDRIEVLAGLDAGETIVTDPLIALEQLRQAPAADPGQQG